MKKKEKRLCDRNCAALLFLVSQVVQEHIKVSRAFLSQGLSLYFPTFDVSVTIFLWFFDFPVFPYLLQIDSRMLMVAAKRIPAATMTNAIKTLS